MTNKCLIFLLALLGAVTTTDAQLKNQNKMIKRNKAVITELIEEGLNKKNSEIALKLAAKDFVDKDAFPNQPNGAEGLKFHFDMLNKAILDLKVEFRLIAEGNTVVEEWSGTGNLVIDFQTGQPLETPTPITQNGITVFELNADGLVMERKTFQRGEQ